MGLRAATDSEAENDDGKEADDCGGAFLGQRLVGGEAKGGEKRGPQKDWKKHIETPWRCAECCGCLPA